MLVCNKYLSSEYIYGIKYWGLGEVYTRYLSCQRGCGMASKRSTCAIWSSPTSRYLCWLCDVKQMTEPPVSLLSPTNPRGCLWEIKKSQIWKHSLNFQMPSHISIHPLLWSFNVAKSQHCLCFHLYTSFCTAWVKLAFINCLLNDTVLGAWFTPSLGPSPAVCEGTALFHNRNLRCVPGGWYHAQEVEELEFEPQPVSFKDYSCLFL